MMSRNRISEDRVPTELERKAVRARMVHTYLDRSKNEHKKLRTFGDAWQEYMEEEQHALNMLIEKEEQAIARDIKTARQIYTIDQVMVNLHHMQVALGYTAMKAIRTFSSSAEDFTVKEERRAA